MNFRHKFGYIALGGLLMLIGMMVSSIFMPNLFAQRDRFGEIECTNLRVVDKEGNVKVLISSDESGRYSSKDREAVFIGADLRGGIVDIKPNYSFPHHSGRGGTITCNTISIAGKIGMPKVIISGFPTSVDNGTTFIGVHEGTGGGVVRVGGRVGGSRYGLIECTNLSVIDRVDNVKVVLGSSEGHNAYLEDTGVVYIGPHTHGKGTVITRDNYDDETNRIR